ncbi:hypothetical protein [Acetobacter senegalensis]|uniref:Uncharacterized protein n=1 Tax=Acetobacter senegalensis TaxID=446692 RepID=A0A149U903_9PROT|nr:hypothetical protein [Acetobacter senegalensis]KXV61777.1 hypothetical protein AD948_00475 [Acetobacter senegalensis]MCG4258325.1 hypothetical protein [Acetobacter senegalensis]MCG4268229.1 hypothetical protein [Acetobacter senegalensis]MPQ75198.1 hypothetical protein [Acetobacter senegalensis]
MKPFLSLSLSLFSALSLLTVSAHAQAASQSDRQMIAHAHWLSAEQARPATASDTATLKAVPDLTKTAGQYHDLCGTRVTPKILSLDVGGTLGTLTAVIEEDPACFGGDGARYTLLDRTHHVVWQNSAAAIAILESHHDGVHDLSFGGPGPETPVWSWSAASHAYQLHVVIDTE